MTTTGRARLTGSGTGLAVTNNATIGGTLAVTGVTTLGGPITLNNNLTTTGRARLTGSGTGLAVTNNATIGGTLAVTGVTTLGGSITLNNNLTTTGRARLTGSGTGLAVTNNATIGGTLTVAESLITGSLFVDGVQITGSSGGGTPEGNLTLTGRARLTGSGTGLAVTNNATIGGTLAVTGGTTLGGTLTVEGIAGTSVNVLTYTPVFVDTDSGLLGTVLSSQRYKNDIRDLGSHKEGLMQLRPVSFSYKADPLNITQYGLIAEEVATAMPELVVFNKEHLPETVAYHILPTLLLNDYQDHEKRLCTVEANAETFTAIVEEIAAIKQTINIILQKII